MASNDSGKSVLLGEALAAALQRHGVDTIFSQCFPMRLQHVARRFGIRQIGFRTENSGGAMADGYARISGRIGVIGAQGGPGATLLVPPLAEAQAASIPLLALVEESARQDADRNAFQEIDHLKLFSGCAKWVRRLSCAERLDDLVDLAVTAAISGRAGPAVLVLPSDLLDEEVQPPLSARSHGFGSYPLDRCVPESRLIEQAAELIAKAERPLLVAGGGVHLSGAAAAVHELSENLVIPVATTNMGKGVLDERLPLALGVFGNTMGKGSSARPLRQFATDADLIIFVGTRTNANGTDSWSLFPPRATYIHIDIDGLEIGRNYEALRLAGDAKSTLELLIASLGTRKLPDRAARRRLITESTARARAESNSYLASVGRGNANAIQPEYLLGILDRVVTAQDIVCADASFSSNWVAAFLTSKDIGSRFLMPRGLAGLGWGFPMAVGAQLARPSARVFAVVGDGGFAHCWSELETARRSGAPVVVIVLNNQVLGLQRLGEEWFFKTHSDAADLGPVDHAAIARACDCFGERVTEPDELEGALKRAIAAGRPALLDVVVSPSARPPVTMFDTRPSGNVAV